jgi:hypothetical protein
VNRGRGRKKKLQRKWTESIKRDRHERKKIGEKRKGMYSSQEEVK